MSNPAESPQVPTPAPNNPPPAKKLADFYQDTYKELFNKLPKPEQEALLKNLSRPNRVVRGEEWPWTNVTRFIKEVAELAEERFDKAQVKAAQALTSKK